MPLKRVKIFKSLNFMLYVSYHNFLKRKKKKTQVGRQENKRGKERRGRQETQREAADSDGGWGVKERPRQRGARKNPTGALRRRAGTGPQPHKESSTPGATTWVQRERLPPAKPTALRARDADSRPESLAPSLHPHQCVPLAPLSITPLQNKID